MDAYIKSQDELSLLRAITEDPLNDIHRSVYADWCLENGNRKRSEFILRQLNGEPASLTFEQLSDYHWFINKRPYPKPRLSTKKDMFRISQKGKPSIMFRRGFPDWIWCDISEWNYVWNKICYEWPITQVFFSNNYGSYALGNEYHNANPSKLNVARQLLGMSHIDEKLTYNRW